MKVKYKIYNPAGNITALVIGDEYSTNNRKIINDKIMDNERNVEQVGFLSEKNIKLTMAGGEFCGNATRCAVAYYLKEEKNIQISINNQKLEAGIDNSKKIWCEMPIENYTITRLDNEIYKVILREITILVVKKIENYNSLEEKARDLMNFYNIDDNAVGVMFVEQKAKYIKIYPIVWVKEINTLFFENSCGSGTIAVSMLESYLSHKSSKYKIMQKSGQFLETEITVKNGKIEKAILIGDIETDNEIKQIII